MTTTGQALVRPMECIAHALQGTHGPCLACRGDLLEALALLDEQEDVNKILKYFSYEHFYVIYCKFWELDSDHNFLLSQEDLLRYGNHALTYRIVDRIFSQVGPGRPPVSRSVLTKYSLLQAGRTRGEGSSGLSILRPEIPGVVTLRQQAMPSCTSRAGVSRVLPLLAAV